MAALGCDRASLCGRNWESLHDSNTAGCRLVAGIQNLVCVGICAATARGLSAVLRDNSTPCSGVCDRGAVRRVSQPGDFDPGGLAASLVHSSQNACVLVVRFTIHSGV